MEKLRTRTIVGWRQLERIRAAKQRSTRPPPPPAFMAKKPA